MKSLEIINICLEELLNNKTEICEYDLLKIKQDLEVLEILKKYLYIVEKQIPRTDDYFEILESDLDEMQDDENCDDFHKVKQWLEEHEHDNKSLQNYTK